MTTVCLIAVSSIHGWIPTQMDVKNTFLNRSFWRCIHDSSSKASSYSGHVCKLHKALYGLIQAPRAWFVLSVSQPFFTLVSLKVIMIQPSFSPLLLYCPRALTIVCWWHDHSFFWVLRSPILLADLCFLSTYMLLILSIMMILLIPRLWTLLWNSLPNYGQLMVNLSPIPESTNNLPVAWFFSLSHARI